VRDNRRQELARLGAISREDAGKVRTEVESLRNDIRAKEEEINNAKLRLQDTASDAQAESYTQKTILIGAQMVRSAQEQISAFEKAIANYEARIKELKTAKESLILTAPISGIVLTNDLDKKQFKELRPSASDDFLLEIADLQQLTAIVEVREEDMKYVEVGKLVTFRPLLDKLRAYNAKVEQILPQVQIDSTQQKKAVLVRIVVDNTDGQLLPKGSGYAKVWSEWIPLYRRIGREVKRLIPIEKFL
jgi:multidrug resistance efflux pump